MRNATRMTTTALVIFLALYVGACKSGGPKMEAPPPQPTRVPTPNAAAVSEQVVHEPITETIVSEEVTEELPEDLAQLNAQGYLEDAFFDTDRFDLTPAAREAIAKDAAWLQKHPTISKAIVTSGTPASTTSRSASVVRARYAITLYSSALLRREFRLFPTARSVRSLSEPARASGSSTVVRIS